MINRFAYHQQQQQQSVEGMNVFTRWYRRTNIHRKSCQIASNFKRSLLTLLPSLCIDGVNRTEFLNVENSRYQHANGLVRAWRYINITQIVTASTIQSVFQLMLMNNTWKKRQRKKFSESIVHIFCAYTFHGKYRKRNSANLKQVIESAKIFVMLYKREWRREKIELTKSAFVQSNHGRKTVGKKAILSIEKVCIQ